MRSSIFALTLLVCAQASAQVAVNDTFNRPNGTNLGANWTEQDADAVLNGGRLQGNARFSFGWSSFNGFSANLADTVVRADFALNGGGGDRISLMAGLNPATWSAIEVRIADNNGDGLIDRVFWNAAVNAGNWPGGPGFTNLTNQVSSGRATLWFDATGDMAFLQIESAMGVEVISNSGINAFAFPITGTSVGVGYFGDGFIENFQAWTGAPTGPVLTLSPPRVGSPLDLILTDVTPSGSVVIGLSLAGNMPQGTPYGPVWLSNPIELLPILSADATGRLEIPVAPLNLGDIGLTVHFQALDIVGAMLSNHFSATAF